MYITYVYVQKYDHQGHTLKAPLWCIYVIMGAKAETNIKQETQNALESNDLLRDYRILQ